MDDVEIAQSVRQKLEDRVPRTDWTEEERRWYKEEKKRQKEAEKAVKKQVKSESSTSVATDWSSAAALLQTLSIDEGAPTFGRYDLVALTRAKGSNLGQRSWVEVSTLDATHPACGSAKEIWLRGRVHTIRPQGSKVAFIVLRHQYATVQVVVAADSSVTDSSREMVRWLVRSGDVTPESVIDVCGVVVPAQVKSCTQNEVEVHAKRLYIVSRALVPLPFEVEDAGRRADEEGPHVHRDTRLDHRFMDLRVPAHQAIIRLQSGVSTLFREWLVQNGFTEIHTPKIIGGTSEGGTEVFRLKYFEEEACLAQSPQLYKQMAICGDMRRVFEVGPVFRAENSNTYRHLTEFISLDVEMEIQESYHEILDVLTDLFQYIFEGIERRYANELACIQRQYPFEPLYYQRVQCLRLSHRQAVDMLREHGLEMQDLADFTSEQEKTLGELVRKRFETDFYVIDRYPSDCRPFYTMPAPDDARYSNAFDVFMRGEEIVSGAQRIHDVELLTQRAQQKGINLQTLQHYLEAFQYGVFPHGGAGIGLERVVMLYLGIGNVRECAMFPRDPKRLHP
jgi:aspartyl-tRNA synthetase